MTARHITQLFSDKARTVLGLMALTLLILGLAAPAGAIPCLSGFMRDTAGNPIGGGDLDFNISSTGQRIITPGDNTDPTGFFTVCVLPNVYDVAFAPPLGTHFLGQLIPDVDLTSEAGLEMNVVLESGHIVSGFVRNSAGLAQFDVDIDVDRVTGGRLYTPNDNTDLTGLYQVVVPGGEYRIRYQPLRGSRLMGGQIDSVLVGGDVTLDIVLQDGFLLQGNIIDANGAAAPEVDIDLRDLLTGQKIYLPNNSTDAAGDYIVAAPLGTYQLRFIPPWESHQVAVDIWGFQLGGDTVSNQTLGSGHRVTVIIEGTGGIPLQGADLDVKDPVTGVKLFTPHDRANAQGQTRAVVPGGNYNLIIDPPAGASYAGALLENVSVTADTTITVQLDGSPRVTIAGKVVDETGTGVVGASFSARLAGTAEVVDLPSETTGPGGVFALDVPPLALDLNLAPPPGSRLVGRRFAAVTAANDTTWNDIVLNEGWLTQVTVKGPSGRPIVGADLDFFDQGTAEEVYTPWDNTGATGQAVVALATGIYRLVVTPPAGSGFQESTMSDLAVAADQNLQMTLQLEPFASGKVELTSCHPNPFRDQAQVDFRLQAPALVTLEVFDLRGRMIKRIARRQYPEGASNETWDGSTESGARAPSGSYVVMLRSALGQASGRITLIR